MFQLNYLKRLWLLRHIKKHITIYHHWSWCLHNLYIHLWSFIRMLSLCCSKLHHQLHRGSPEPRGWRSIQRFSSGLRCPAQQFPWCSRPRCNKAWRPRRESLRSPFGGMKGQQQALTFCDFSSASFFWKFFIVIMLILTVLTIMTIMTIL